MSDSISEFSLIAQHNCVDYCAKINGYNLTTVLIFVPKCYETFSVYRWRNKIYTNSGGVVLARRMNIK